MHWVVDPAVQLRAAVIAVSYSAANAWQAERSYPTVPPAPVPTLPPAPVPLPVPSTAPAPPVPVILPDNDRLQAPSAAANPSEIHKSARIRVDPSKGQTKLQVREMATAAAPRLSES